MVGTIRKLLKRTGNLIIKEDIPTLNENYLLYCISTIFCLKSYLKVNTKQECEKSTT